MNREQRRAYHRAYAASHREQKAASSRAYYASHREQKAASSRAYHARHPKLRPGELPIHCHACRTVLATIHLQDMVRYHPPQVCPHCGESTHAPILTQPPVPRTNHQYLSEVPAA